ncbi:MAG: hypothetical protein JST00_35755 [Deltaproteobacteria bacterium]|nr:hypothetical protein [Deltaproteobacteria bacterium]
MTNLHSRSLSSALVVLIASGALAVACGPKGDDASPPTPPAASDAGTSGSDAASSSDGQTTPSSTSAKIGTGEQNTCAILDGGGVKCWGSDAAGQLGQARGDYKNELAPKPLAPIDLEGRKAVSVGAGKEHACALFDDGKVKCWGNNTLGGALGIGGNFGSAGGSANTMGANLPVVELGGKAVALTVGTLHNCALLEDGTAKCWGNNDGGALGMASTDDYWTPGRAIDAGAKIKMISAGYRYTCAVLEDGILKCWGDNVTGTLGLGDTENRANKPGQTVAALPAVDVGGKVVSVSAGYYHTCALLEGGKVKCWGSNRSGELGQGDIESRGTKPNEMGAKLPPIDLDGVATAVVAGDASTCALLEGGKVKCWGANDAGTVGLGEPGPRGYRPNEMGKNLPALDLPPTVALSMRSKHVCATSTTGEVRCWGSNSHGQLGYGDREPRALVGAKTPAIALE